MVAWISGEKRQMPKVIEAAGGLVWRHSLQDRTIAVIHRPRYDDWGLPKGKLHEGEDWVTAATREVEEETGCKTRLGSFAGSVTYDVDGNVKVVRFWNMFALEDCKFRPSDEVDQLLWLSVEAALERLDYPGEKTLLQSVVGSPDFVQ